MTASYVDHDHFIGQFANHGPSDTARFHAAARHAAHLHNSAVVKDAEELVFLTEILDNLKEGTNPVVIALKIDARIREMKDDGT